MFLALALTGSLFMSSCGGGEKGENFTPQIELPDLSDIKGRKKEENIILGRIEALRDAARKSKDADSDENSYTFGEVRVVNNHTIGEKK